MYKTFVFRSSKTSCFSGSGLDSVMVLLFASLPSKATSNFSKSRQSERSSHTLAVLRSNLSRKKISQVRGKHFQIHNRFIDSSLFPVVYYVRTVFRSFDLLCRLIPSPQRSLRPEIRNSRPQPDAS